MVESGVERALLTVRWTVRVETERVAGVGAPALHQHLSCVHEALALSCPTGVSHYYYPDTL